jgi:uncharacterized membrane protein YeaQ/YmgE (transglycosylase-associated protein family)
VVAGINVSGLLPPSISGATAKSGILEQLGHNIIDNVAGAVVNSAINHTSLEDGLKDALISAIITTGAAQAANAIGDAKQLAKIDTAAQYIAHAVVGCMAGAAANATTGNGAQGSNASACSAGALGAMVGEYSAGLYNPEGDTNQTARTVAFASMMAGLNPEEQQFLYVYRC